MDKRLHETGSGVGYTPPIDKTVFRILVGLSTAIVVLAGLVAHILARIGF